VSGMFSLATRSGRATRRAFVYTLLLHILVSVFIVTQQEAISARGHVVPYSSWEFFVLFPATLGLGWFDPIFIQWFASSATWAAGVALLVRALTRAREKS
jgi:hypothetical protein